MQEVEGITGDSRTICMMKMMTLQLIGYSTMEEDSLDSAEESLCLPPKLDKMEEGVAVCKATSTLLNQ